MSKGYLAISYSLHSNIIIMMSHTKNIQFELFTSSIKSKNCQDTQLLPSNYPLSTIFDLVDFYYSSKLSCKIESFLSPSEFSSKCIIVTISQSINIITSNMTTMLIPPLKTTCQAELIEINDSPSQLPSLFDQLIAEYADHDSLQDQQYSTPIQATEESSGHEWSNTLETQDVSIEKAINEVTRIEEEVNTSNDDHDSIQILPTLPQKAKRPKQKKSHQRVSKVNPFSPTVEKNSSEVQPQKSKKIVKAARMVLQPFWSFSWNILGSS